MFWKREKIVTNGALGMLEIIPIKPKKEFETMLQMLRDAEKYDNATEKDVSIALLTNLCEYIERYKTNNK